MKLLLTNDDGIDAPGLAALAQAASAFGAVVVVAPFEAHSGCSHRVTTHQPIRVIEKRSQWFAVDGTPADCVRVGLHSVAPDADWILSGVNEGGNLGADVYLSGTVAAVREGVLHGKPGIAFSHYLKRRLAIGWDRAAVWAGPILAELLAQSVEPGRFWNVNMPHLEAEAGLPGLVHCPLESGPLPVRYRKEGELLHYDGNYHQRQRRPGTDVDVCFGGRIAITEMKIG